jgi:small subunit ribosomal protein S9
MAEKKTAKAKTTKKEPAAKKTVAKKETVKKEKKPAAAKVKATKAVEVKEEEKVLPIISPEFIFETKDKDDEDFVFDESKYDENSSRYFEAVGRRKTSVARVRLYTKGDKVIIVNGKAIEEYFTTLPLKKTVSSSLDKMKSNGRFRITVVVKGGGISSQAEAVRHGITRALVVFNPEYRKRLRKAGFLTRDSRMKERKKFGLKRARKAPQWSKR